MPANAFCCTMAGSQAKRLRSLVDFLALLYFNWNACNKSVSTRACAASAPARLATICHTWEKSKAQSLETITSFRRAFTCSSLKSFDVPCPINANSLNLCSHRCLRRVVSWCEFWGSHGLAASDMPVLLLMVASGKLLPEKLVTRHLERRYWARTFSILFQCRQSRINLFEFWSSMILYDSDIFRWIPTKRSLLAADVQCKWAHPIEGLRSLNSRRVYCHYCLARWGHLGRGCEGRGQRKLPIQLQ